MMKFPFFHIQVVKEFYQLLKENRLSRSALDALISRRLKYVLTEAYRHVPYSRELMDRIGYRPFRDYHGPGDLASFPFLTKQLIKQNDITDFVRQGTNLSHASRAITSGSTGTPLQIYQSGRDVAVRTARPLYIGRVNGYSLLDKVMGIVPPGRLRPGVRCHKRVGLSPKLTVDYSRYTIPELVDTLLDYKPAALYGNRAHLDLMALELKRRKISPERVGLKFLSGGAEVFHASNRQLYREQFGVELLDMYGSTELGLLAYETTVHDGLHLFESQVYYEFLDDGNKPVPPGTPGRLVVTDLTRTLMPFIRYEQGDLAVYSETLNDKGERDRRITQIVGREETDYIQLPDGSQTTAFQILGVVKNYLGIVQFRAIQHTLSHIEILIVADPAYFRSISDELLQHLQHSFPPTIVFTLTPVVQIEPEPNGKMKTFVSELEMI